MATYGNYETVGRIYSIGARSVYSAKAVGGAKDAFVVKIVSADDVFGEDPADVLRDFTQRAKIQQKLGESKASAWTVVHEVGQRDSEVYYVTDRAASSAQQLVAGKVRTEGADLYRVVSAVIQGLRELRAAANRAHANLKPSNVLIDRTGDVASATVLLTDPSGAAQPKPAEAEHSDVQDLGDLIHQLVLHVPFRAMGGYPIEDSPNWGRLGKTGQQWRALTNRMLDPAAAPGSLTIESLAGEIDGLRARAGGGGGKRAIVIGAAAGLVLIGGGVAAMMMMRKPADGPVPVRFDAEEWKRWVAEADWAMPLRDEMNRADRRAALEGDEYLRTALLPLAGETVELDPRNATPEVRARRLQLAALAVSPPPEASNAEGAAATTAANDWIGRVQDAISAEKWPAHRALKEAETRLSAVGLDRLGEFARLLIARLENRDDGGRLVSSIIEASRVAPSVERLVAALEGVRPEHGQEIMTWVVNETDFITLGTQVSLLDELSGYLDQNEARFTATTVVASVPGGGNNSGTNSGTNSTTPPGGTGTDPDLTNVEQTVVVVPEPPPVVDIGPDPREGWTASATLETVRSRLRESWVSELEGGSARGAAQASGDVESIGQILAGVQGLEWTEATRDQVREEMSRVESRLSLASGVAEQLFKDYEAQRAAVRQSEEEAAAQAQRDFDEFVEQFSDRTPEVLRSEYLRLQWDYRRGLVLREHDEPSELADLRNEALRLERDVTTAESGIPMPTAPEAGPSGYDAGALGAYFAARREAAIEAAWQVGVGDGFGQQFEAAVQAQRGELTAMADAARRAIADMALADAGIRSAAAWDEPLNRAEPPDTLASLLARWQAMNAGPELTAAVGATPAALAQVGALNASLSGAASASAEELNVLVDLVADANEPLIGRLYSWRALRANQGVTVPAEQEMLASLRTAIEALPAARQATLRAEFDQAGGARWLAAIESAGNEAAYQSALDSRQALGGNMSQVSARTQFNLRLVGAAGQLRQLGANATDDQVREVLNQIVALADRDATVWQDDASVNAWIGSVRAAVNRPSGTNVDVLTQRGPGAAGWSFEALDPGGQRVRYTRSGGGETVSVEFVRLDPGTDGVVQPVYLATTEVSLRVFGAAANAAGAWGRIESAWGDRLLNTDDSWDGPKTWMYNSGSPNRLVRNERWLSVQGSGSFNIRQPFAAPEEQRTVDLPVQYITAPAARAFAQAVGCRLPTSQEWTGARRREGGSGWNLRDAAWTAQRDFAAARQVRPPLWPYPDAGAFVPVGREVAVEGDALAVPGASDGVLYFQAVDGGGASTFKHLVGNVAEFVDDSPAGYAGSEETRSYRVVGGSAISPPELGTDQALPLVTDPLDNFMVPTNTYADVGFRLAFDAGQMGGGPPLAQQVGELVGRMSLVARR